MFKSYQTEFCEFFPFITYIDKQIFLQKNTMISTFFPRSSVSNNTHIEGAEVFLRVAITALNGGISMHNGGASVIH